MQLAELDAPEVDEYIPTAQFAQLFEPFEDV
jgi:hypothetical protein